MLLIESSAMADDLVRCMGMVISRGMPVFSDYSFIFIFI